MVTSPIGQDEGESAEEESDEEESDEEESDEEESDEGMPQLEEPMDDYDYKVPITPMISHINYVPQYRATLKHYLRIALLW